VAHPKKRPPPVKRDHVADIIGQWREGQARKKQEAVEREKNRTGPTNPGLLEVD
jgi:hypothetical protein